jgi:hypothetical protein
MNYEKKRKSHELLVVGQNCLCFCLFALGIVGSEDSIFIQKKIPKRRTTTHNTTLATFVVVISIASTVTMMVFDCVLKAALLCLLALATPSAALINCDDVLLSSSPFVGQCDNKWSNLKPLLHRKSFPMYSIYQEV